jgi:rhamnogalacturonyl hydrolase YesR
MNDQEKENAKPFILASLQQVQKWVEDHAYKAYEPFDGLSSWARPLAFGTIMGDRLLMQLIRQSPVNLRPFFGVTPKESTKGRGYMARGYLILYRTTGREEFKNKAVECLRWLDKHKAGKYARHSWANHFDFSSRGGRYTSEDPIIVWTSLIGQAYLDAYEITGDKWFLEIADSVCGWIMDLPREKTATGNCLSYLMPVQNTIHNANMLGAAMLARTARHTGNQDYIEVARSAMEYSVSRQLPDGSWWYAEYPNHQWIDNFHTGYNLDSLKCYIENTGDEAWRPNLLNGLEFFKAHFFEASGRPKYYHTRTYPVDSQCAAQAIETLAEFSDLDPSCLDLAVKVARWTIENMQDADGHFYYRQYPLGIKAKAPMLHWAQATTFKALAQLHAKLAKKTAGVVADATVLAT